jgi:hypothetical protein
VESPSTVPKNRQSADPWYCDDDWRTDPGFEEALPSTWLDDPFYVASADASADAGAPRAQYLESGLEAVTTANWRTGAGF